MPASIAALALLLPLCWLCACAGTAGNAEESAAARGDAAGAKTMPVERDFEAGPAVEEREQLLAWLAQHAREGGSARTLRLPIALGLRDGGLHLGDAHLGLGSAEGGVGGERLVVLLDDSALGISLLDRVRQLARADGSCELWLEGSWLGSTRSGGSFAVQRVKGPIGAAEREAASRVYVESASSR